MRSLGKQEVRVVTMREGNVTLDEIERRVVYETKDGTYKVNWLSGHRAVTKEEGVFLLAINARSIPALSGSEFIAALRGAGQP
jgi:hypothetical protein